MKCLLPKRKPSHTDTVISIIKCMEVYNCCSHGYFTEWSGALGNTEQLCKSSLQCPISTSCISLDRTRQPWHAGACIVGTCILVLELWPQASFSHVISQKLRANSFQQQGSRQQGYQHGGIVELMFSNVPFHSMKQPLPLLLLFCCATHIPSVISDPPFMPSMLFLQKRTCWGKVHMRAFGMKSQKFISAFHQQCFLSTVCVCTQ